MSVCEYAVDLPAAIVVLSAVLFDRYVTIVITFKVLSDYSFLLSEFIVGVWQLNVICKWTLISHLHSLLCQIKFVNPQCKFNHVIEIVAKPGAN